MTIKYYLLFTIIIYYFQSATLQLFTLFYFVQEIMQICLLLWLQELSNLVYF